MIYTIGYESKNIDEFISNLKSHRISALVDVREIPISRKAGFSKSKLSERLQNSEIDYIHIRELGSPKHLRNKLKQDGDIKYFFNEYSKYINSKKIVLEQLHQLILKKISCLMCFEKFPEKCHRTIVAKEIKKINNNGLLIKHI